MSEKPPVAVTRANLPGDGLTRLAERAELRIWPEDRPPKVEELVKLVGDARVALCANGDPMNSQFLNACPNLKAVVLASMGYDSIDVHEAVRLGIQVTNTPGVLAETVADLTFALILWARRRLGVAERHIRDGKWVDNGLWNLLGYDIHGSTLGIVGYGAIGRAVAARAAGFGMKVIAHDAFLKEAPVPLVSLDELLRQSDVVSLHMPLSAETRGLIGERELRLMKPTATLVNTARGGVIDEPALIRALREGWIDSAGLDVQAHEPNSDPADPLLAVPGLVVLPHVGSATFAARSGMIDLAVNNVIAFLDGKPLLTLVAESRDSMAK